MNLTDIQKKRLLTFVVLAVLLIIPFVTESKVLKIMSVIITVIYVGFIIFLRKADEKSLDINTLLGGDTPKVSDTTEDGFEEPIKKGYDTDFGEEIKIIKGGSFEYINDENYSNFKFTPPSNKDFFKPPELKETYFNIASEVIPADLKNSEPFDFVLEQVLGIIKEIYNAHTAIFFFYDEKKEKLIMERSVSNSNEISNRKFIIEDDVLSKVVKNQEPEILVDIPATVEADIIRYYLSPQGIKSIVAVPLFFNGRLSGVLAIDSKNSDNYGVETIYQLGRYVKIISYFIELFEYKFKEGIAESRLNALFMLLDSNKKFNKESDLNELLVVMVKNLINWDAFSFVSFNPIEKKHRTSLVLNNTSLKYIRENYEVDIDGTLSGKAIMTGLPVKIDDTSLSEYIRFNKSEDISFDGSFLAIPLVYDNQNFGVLCFESMKIKAYSNADMLFLQSATKILSYIIFTIATQTYLKQLISLDVETNVLNDENFKKRLYEELLKSKQINIPGAIALIQLDNFAPDDDFTEDDDLCSRMMISLASIIKEQISEVELIGRLSRKVFAVYFFNSTTKDVYIKAEQMRVKIARNTFNIGTKQATATASIGVSPTNEFDNVDDVLENANMTLRKALEKGGNKVAYL